jgi:hypothetical protein
MRQVNADDLTVYVREPYIHKFTMFALFFHSGGPRGGPFTWPLKDPFSMAGYILPRWGHPTNAQRLVRTV